MIRPNGERIVVKPIQQADTTQGGLFLPDQAIPPETTGEVLDIGHTLPPFDVGDTVYYNRNNGNLITSNGEEYLVLHVRDVIAYERKGE